MTRTKDKIMLGALVILLIGMSGVFITAMGNDSQEYQRNSNQIVVRETASTGNVAQETEMEENGNDDFEQEITGSALERASAAALQYIGEGRVTDSEIGDEESYYEIEITLEDGRQVDVQLDENFNVVGTEWENEQEDDD